MPNPFYQSNAGNNLRNIYQALVNSKNPMQTFNILAQQNPKMKPVLDMLNNGADPQVLFNNLCQQRGINPDEFIKSII